VYAFTIQLCPLPITFFMLSSLCSESRISSVYPQFLCSIVSFEGGANATPVVTLCVVVPIVVVADVVDGPFIVMKN